MSELDGFMQLFQGRTDVYGSVEGRSNKEPVTPELYKAHFEGKKSLGIYPLQDDGTIRFFAVDLDEKNWEKALLIRNELVNIGVPIYICESKSKGFHIYGFASEPLIAKDVREVLVGMLMKLNITCEVFPKQDKLDEIIKYGNYINLPVYGNTRQFQDTNHQPVPFGLAFQAIQYNTQDSILKAKAKVPPIPPPMLPVKPDKEKEKKSETKKGKSPPCVLRILKGVDSGMRDEAAFALARHYLDQGDLPEEVLAMLLIWDAKNRPPMADMKILQTKVQSAEHGYAFGCNSITEGILSGFCVGKQNCEWLKREVERKVKSGLIQTTSMYEDGDLLYEEIIKNPTDMTKAQSLFLRADLATGTTSEVKEIQVGDITYIPIYDKSIADGLVVMPSGTLEYGSTEELMHEIESYIYRYADFSKEFQEWASWWVLMTWVYDRLPSVSYLRFLGDWGTGKSRALDTVGSICYKRTKITGAVTAAAIYRVLDQFKGTLIIDENDMDNKSEISGVLTKILNSGIERGSPIIRCQNEGEGIFGINTFQVFGPKIFATRNTFEDMALESRCLTTKMQETTRPINSREANAIPFTIYSRECLATQERLRNKLLLFRLRHLSHVPRILGEDDCLDMDIGKISGRLKQVCLPFATIFRDNPETMDKFRRFLERYQKEIYGETADSYQGRIVSAMFRAALAIGKEKFTCNDIAREAKEEGITGRGGIDISPIVVSKILKGMNVKVKGPVHADVVESGEVKRKTKRYIEWDPERMQSIFNRYQPGLEKEELQKLELRFEGPTIP